MAAHIFISEFDVLQHYTHLMGVLSLLKQNRPTEFILKVEKKLLFFHFFSLKYSMLLRVKVTNTSKPKLKRHEWLTHANCIISSTMWMTFFPLMI